MQLGIVGLGRMGSNIARRLMEHGHQIVAFDVNPQAMKALSGAVAAPSLQALVEKLTPPRAVWVMLPAGEITEHAIEELGALLQAGDTIIDGGNTFYKDDIRRARTLAGRNIHYLDAGTSGGIWGYARGYCLMIGGEKEFVQKLDPVFAALAPGEGGAEPTPHRKGRDPRPARGYVHAGRVGAGHFVKMVHNGIEYGMMQAIAEGFDILSGKNSKDLPEGERYALDLADIAETWRRGSVISSWLLDLTARALAQSPSLEDFTGFVEDSGEGRWTVNAAVEEAVAAPVITSSLYARFRSRRAHTFGEKMLSAMRNEFGGHVEQHGKKASR
jgi:6-phosphogluconate dehydrogenase